jgi:SAM-dependent methyltransferase
MNRPIFERRMPQSLRRRMQFFEAQIDEALAKFGRDLPDGARLLDCGAGLIPRSKFFPRQKYLAVDHRIGDQDWDYRGLDAAADLLKLPFPDRAFDACASIIALEHMRDPAAALAEMARTLPPGAPLLLVAPHEWEVNHVPRDYFRFTRYGLRYLLERAGFTQVHVYPIGGFFRLLSRRLLNAIEFFPGFWSFVAALVLIPPALVLPVFDSLDRERNFTLGYLCTAKRSS